MDDPSVCVLLADDGAESKQARQLLHGAKIPFSEVRKGTPGREALPAPILYTRSGPLPTIGLIQAWVDCYPQVPA
jgi:hypothetical protein